MARHVYPDVSAVSIAFMFALVTLGMNDSVLAAGECIEQPDREPAQGAHWYYRYDREKNRKCWHLEDATPKAREAMLPQKDRSDAVAPPPVTPAVPSLFGGWSTAPRTSMPQSATPGEPRIIQSDPTKPLKIEDIAQQRPDIPEERAEERYVTPLSPAQRRALFEEYLKWEELQRNLGNLGAPVRAP